MPLAKFDEMEKHHMELTITNIRQLQTYAQKYFGSAEI